MNINTPRGVQEDPHVRAALEWLLSISPDPSALTTRIRAAQTYYRANSGRINSRWPQTSQLLTKSDLIAGYLGQVDAFLNDRRSYDLLLGARILPFFKHIGRGVRDIANVPGAATRARRLLQPNLEHPDGAIFELVAAVRYVGEHFEVEFIPESAERSADMRLGASGLDKFMHIECKRLRPSVYELREGVYFKELFEPLEVLIHQRELNLHVDVNFKIELGTIPKRYLADRVAPALASSSIVVPGGYPWSDEFAEGKIRASRLDLVQADISDTSLLVGSKMARLLCGKPVMEGSYQLALAGMPRREDPRYVDSVSYASVLTWQCSAPASVDARARHIRSKLADIDRQMESANMGIVHIGMDAERDITTADLRRERNLKTVRSFYPTSNIVEVNLHYYLPRVTESTAWTIDETVDWNCRVDHPLLDDARLLMGPSDLDTDVAAWHLPPP
jgi:hypothetical protein